MNAPLTIVIARMGDQPDSELARGVNQVSIQSDPHGRPFALTFWQNTGVGTRIESVMQDLAERIEIGVLSATRVSKPLANEVLVMAPREFAEELELTKLIIEIEDKRLESGLIFTGSNGREVVILAGAHPYSLAIRGLGEALHCFEPEYPIASYQRCKIPHVEEDCRVESQKRKGPV